MTVSELKGWQWKFFRCCTAPSTWLKRNLLPLSARHYRQIHAMDEVPEHVWSGHVSFNGPHRNISKVRHSCKPIHFVQLLGAQAGASKWWRNMLTPIYMASIKNNPVVQIIYRRMVTASVSVLLRFTDQSPSRPGLFTATYDNSWRGEVVYSNFSAYLMEIDGTGCTVRVLFPIPPIIHGNIFSSRWLKWGISQLRDGSVLLSIFHGKRLSGSAPSMVLWNAYSEVLVIEPGSESNSMEVVANIH